MSVTIAGFAAGAQSGIESIGWVLPTVLAVVAFGAGALVVVLRERHHHRRRAELESRLAGLEKILLDLPAVADARTSSSGSTTASTVSSIHGAVVPRGPLSTVISTLRNDVGPGLPGPDRVDLRATIFIYEHLDQPTTPADLADGLNLSLRSVQRALSNTLGCTPRELILAVKMREAKRLLLDDGCRVQEAARAVGFDDPFHFSRRFKAYYRQSPTEMQERVNRNVA